MLKELGTTQKSTRIAQNIVGFIELAEDDPGIYFSQKEHVDLRHRFVSESTANETIHLVKGRKGEMKADFITEPLQPFNFESAVPHLNLVGNKH